VVAANVAVLVLTATVTLAGMANTTLLLVKATVEVLSAALFNVTVQVLDALFPRVDGVQDIEESCAGALAASANVCDAPLRAAERIAAWSALMAPTVAVNAALGCPARTVTLGGTVMLELLLDRVIVAPAVGAAEVKVTVQVEVPGAFTVAGEQLRLPGCTAIVRLIDADWLMPFKEPVTVTVWALPTVAVVAAKVAML
jgi:hypothetical protein